MSLFKRLPILKIEWDRNKVAMAGLAALYLFFLCATLYNVLGDGYRERFMTIFGFELELDSYYDWEDRVSVKPTALLILLAAAGLFYKRMSIRGRSIYFHTLLASVCLTLFTVYMKPGVIRPYYADTGDAFNYFLVPKYFGELGYRESYNCAMTAQMERGRKLPKRMRDLSSNQMVRVKDRVTEDVQDRCRSLFTKERWAEYVEDIDNYRSWFTQKRWDHWFIDHGYNGTPVRSFFAGIIANAAPLGIESLSLLSLMNSLVVTAMLIVAVRVFGWRAGLFFAGLFAVNYADRFILAGAFMRYFWLASLVIGVAMLERKRYGLAAGFLVFSGMFQVFPVLFLAGMGLKIAFELIKSRRVSPGHRRFVLSGLVTAAVLFALSLSVGRGLTNWREFLHQMDLNSGRMATGRIGYVYNFLYPKEIFSDEKQGDYRAKAHAAETEPVAGPITLFNIKNLTTLLILVSVILLIGRTNETEYTLILGFALFFMLFGTVRYYYAGLLGFPLIYHRHMRGRPGQLYFLLALAVMAAAYLLQPHTIYSFVYNTVLTAAFTAMLIGTVVFLYLRRPPESEEQLG